MGVVANTERKNMEQKRTMRTHQDRNQVTDIRVGVRERSMVMVLRARGDLPNRDVGPTPGGNMTRRDLRKGAVGLALATHGVVAKKVMVPALVSWKETDTSHMSAPQGNPERHVNRDLNLRVGEGRVVVACHVDWKPEGTNQTLLSRAGVEDKRLHLALEVQETTEDKARQVVPAIQRGVEGHDMPLVLVTLGHSANHRAVEANREEDQVSPHAVDNLGLRKVSLPLTVNKELVPVNSL